MQTLNFKIGQIVKYSSPLNQEEADARFIVKEIHPSHMLCEKLHVELICDMSIRPISVYFSEEFTNA